MPLHKYPPAIWKSLKLKEGIYARLPPHYLKSLNDTEKPTPVHWKPHGLKYRKNPKTGQRERVSDVPIPPYFPPEASDGLWGGEGWVTGYRYANNDKLSTRLKVTWKPQLFIRQLYSEILDKTFSIKVTMRTLDLIDATYGFDFYILQTPQRDLCSKLGMDLKRAMLMRLATKDPNLHPNDHTKREQIYNKYKGFLHEFTRNLCVGTEDIQLVSLQSQPGMAFEIPFEEAEWVGLSLEEAVEKKRLLEKKDPTPVFKTAVNELINALAAKKLEEPAVIENRS